MPASPSLRRLTRHWTGRLAAYRTHRNDEHREALVEEAARFAGFHLEDALSRDPYWSESPLGRRVAVLLYLVDRGAVARIEHQGRIVYDPATDAERWATSQPSLAPYLPAVLALIAALRQAQLRRAVSRP